MSATPGAAPSLRPIAAELAAAAEALGEAEWARAAAELAGGERREPRVPTYGDLARRGAELVERLAHAGAWAEAEAQAVHLARYFTRARARLHAVAGACFDGLVVATRARDGEDVDEMTALVREVFGDGDGRA